MVSKKVSILVALSALLMGPGAMAQDQGLEEVIVQGVRSQIRDSLEQKRNADGFVEAIGADDLGKFPDLNLGESLQRLAGVTLNRSNNSGIGGARGEGDGSQVNLRGLGPEFTRIEINGVSGASNFSSAFDFNILASELFSNVRVYKTQTAKLAEGGMAGVVQLETPSAFDRKGLTFVASATGQYGESAEEVDPRIALLVSQNWDDRIGITASVAFSDTLFQTNAAGGISARALGASGTAALDANSTQIERNALIPTTINYETVEDNRETVGATLGFQFRSSDSLEFKIDGIYSKRDSDSVFTRADAPPESGIFNVSNSTVENGVLTSATLDNVQNRLAVFDTSVEEELSVISGEVIFNPNENWTINPYIGYSEREFINSDSLLSFARGERDAAGALTGNLGRFPVSYNINGDFVPFTSGGGYSTQADANEMLLNIFLYQPSIDNDEEFSTKLDFSFETEDSGPLKRVDFGGRFSDREISRSRSFFIIDNNRVTPPDLTTLPTLGDFARFVDFDISGSPGSFPGDILSGDPTAITNAFLTTGFDVTRPGAVVPGDVSATTVSNLTIPGTIFIDLRANAAVQEIEGSTETIALYAESTFEWDNLLVNAGFRYVDTEQTSSGFSLIDNVAAPTSVTNDYSEVLPSLSARFSVSDNINFRAAFSKTLTRPTLFDSRVSEQFVGIDESGGAGGSKGNPDLLPFTSNNLDIGAEFYFGDEGLVSVTYFQKTIDDLIVTDTVTEDRTFRSQVTGLDVTAPILFVVPTNSDQEAKIDGLEVSAQGRFNFLPEGWLRNFGGIFNYTFVDSDSAFQSEGDDVQGSGLPGLSSDSFNAIVYYDDGRFDGRLSYAWRDRYLNLLNDSFGVPSFAKARGQLDFSLNYNVTDSLELQFQGLNLTEEPYALQSVSRLPHTTAQFERRWFFGARYVFN